MTCCSPTSSSMVSVFTVETTCGAPDGRGKLALGPCASAVDAARRATEATNTGATDAWALGLVSIDRPSLGDCHNRALGLLGVASDQILRTGFRNPFNDGDVVVVAQGKRQLAPTHGFCKYLGLFDGSTNRYRRTSTVGLLT